MMNIHHAFNFCRQHVVIITGSPAGYIDKLRRTRATEETYANHLPILTE